jgi:hypothetical protein
MYDWARFAADGYECSTAGDTRFSALCARLSDGRTIEEAYQLDVKGYRAYGTDWRLGKGKPPLRRVNLWQSYLCLWRQWARENPLLMVELATRARYRVLTDRFATTGISQARALAQLLTEAHVPSRSDSGPAVDTPPAVHEYVATTPAVPPIAPAPDKR